MVADVALRIDGESRLAFGGEDIAGVEIGMKEHGIAATPRELTEQTALDRQGEDGELAAGRAGAGLQAGPVRGQSLIGGQDVSAW